MQTDKQIEKKIKRRNWAFILLIIIIFVPIILIFTVYISAMFFGCDSDDPICKTKSDIRVLESSLELYKLDNYRYPTNDQGLDALLNKPSDDSAPGWREGGYIKRLIKDPWGNYYRYAYPGSYGEFDVFSLGADGTVGGQGEAADIGNWNLDS